MAKSQIIRDWRGRVYNVGESAQDLTGRPRSWMLWLPWAAMLAIGPLQYGYGAAIPHLIEDRGWSLAETLWPLAVWAVCQGAVALPVARLLDGRHAELDSQGRIGCLGVRPALAAAALLCGIGLYTLAATSSPIWLLLGYGLSGGVGAGVVYAVCGGVVSRWFPERPAAHVGFATGAFAYGAVPLVVAVPYQASGAFLVSAAVAVVTVGAAAALVRTPPLGWWPPHLDPSAWSLGNRAFRTNPRAAREFSTRQAVRTGVLPALCVVLVLAASVSIFDVVSVALRATPLEPAAWAAVALLIAANGAGRAVAMVVSERIGRRRVLSRSLALLAVGQFLLASDTATGSAAGLITAALVAGLGGGAFYPLIASLARDYFGERTTEIHAVVYSAKAVAGVLGVGLVLLTSSAWGQSRVFVLAGALAVCSAALSTRLRQPGRPSTLPQGVAASTRTEKKAAFGRP